eukprot:664235-Rhodomonas_salina.5
MSDTEICTGKCTVLLTDIAYVGTRRAGSRMPAVLHAVVTGLDAVRATMPGQIRWLPGQTALCFVKPASCLVKLLPGQTRWVKTAVCLVKTESCLAKTAICRVKAKSSLVKNALSFSDHVQY